ncbi:MAG TPA: type II toxin-antitoxin system VapC family toxin [Rhizomicrobium sp.]
MIVIDSSAIIAVRAEEPGWEILVARLSDESPTQRYISAATFLEAGTVIAGRSSNPEIAPKIMDDFLAKHSLEIVPVDAEQARIALQARIRLGRGFGHPAKLNFGDCFSYALAKTLKAPLLYVGDDFDKTDVKSALRRKRKTR